MDRSTTDHTTIRLPETAVAELRERIADTEFESVEEYVLFVIDEIIEADGGREREATVETGGEVEERLEELGYL
jgi:Arc/MetJ-type ribon-helix-helix transcriptional regulator